jgi:hypothetical protein
MVTLTYLKNWWRKNESRVSSFALVGGFILDNLTLTRIDLFYGNILLFSYIGVAAFCIIFLNLCESRQLPARFSWVHPALLLLIQFVFGGLFSAFLVFYFRSSSLVQSWPFVLILAGLLLGNEVFKTRYLRLGFQISIFFITLFSFTIFYLPIVLGQIGPLVFLLSGATSIGLVVLFIIPLARIVPAQYQKSKNIIFISIPVIFLVINLLYFTNSIPPIPLALKESSVAHGVEHTGSGDYLVSTEAQDWYMKFLPEKHYHTLANAPIYIYSSVFSPTHLNTQIVHEWQYYNPIDEAWQTTDKISFPIIGGRDGGYRGYSSKSTVASGRWRVNVETPRGQTIGRINFQVEEVSTLPELVSEMR